MDELERQLQRLGLKYSLGCFVDGHGIFIGGKTWHEEFSLSACGKDWCAVSRKTGETFSGSLEAVAAAINTRALAIEAARS